MSKNAVSIITFLILLVIFVGAFSSSYTSHNMSNLAYVLAIGIDVGENAKMKVSAQFTKSSSFSPNSGSSEESSTMVSAEADSIYNGLTVLNSYIGKEINLSHCSVVVFSEEFAKNGISSQIYSLLNNEEFRPTTNLVISTCDAFDYLSNVKPNLEKITTNYYDTFSITNKFTGYFSDISVGEFFNTLSEDYCDGTAILGGLDKTARKEEEKKSSGSNNSSDSSDNSNSDSSSDSSNKSSSSSETSDNMSNLDSSNSGENIVTDPKELVAGLSSIQGKRGSENIGLAVFDEDKMCGKLTALETICHLLIQNNVDSCIVSIDNPFPENGEKKIGLNITPSKKSKIDVKIEDGIPHIFIKISVNSSILTLETNMNYQNQEVLNSFSNSAEEYFKKEFNNYFNKISKKYGTDIDCFGIKALSNFSTQQEWKDFNWHEKFKSAKFDIDINVDVVSSQLLNKT